MTTLEEVADRISQDGDRAKRMGFYIGLLAICLAISSWAGSNSTLAVMQKQVQIANTWAFFQAKNIRRSMLSVAIDQARFELMGLSADDKRREWLTNLGMQWARDADHLTSEPTTGEGMRELTATAHQLERELDNEMRLESLFGLANVFFQAAITMAGLALIVVGVWPVIMSGGCALFGAVLMIGGLLL